ncbi:unnamed protein product, partial [Timema podura]|nr:unnamed protein product [Timema podura]
MEEERMPNKALKNKEKGRRLQTRWMDQAQKDIKAKGVDWRRMAEGDVCRDRQDWKRWKRRIMMMLGTMKKKYTGDESENEFSVDEPEELQGSDDDWTPAAGE